MEFHQVILISLQVISISSRNYDSSSDESIENLLYFKDCQKKDESTHPPVEKLHATPKNPAMDCPFPKMCCSITCNGNDQCASPTVPYNVPQDEGADKVYSPFMPLSAPSQYQTQPEMPKMRKKKAKQSMRMHLPMLPTRRDSGFTKDRIKNLINQDEDIRKILKDLVRVTMQKVDLVDMMNTRPRVTPAAVQIRPTTQKYSAIYDDNDEDDLE